MDGFIKTMRICFPHSIMIKFIAMITRREISSLLSLVFFCFFLYFKTKNDFRINQQNASNFNLAKISIYDVYEYIVKNPCYRWRVKWDYKSSDLYMIIIKKKNKAKQNPHHYTMLHNINAGCQSEKCKIVIIPILIDF